LSLGCHFLYEGIWKIDHSDLRYDARWKADGAEPFTARPFLALAKGPVAGFFYAMLPDIDARQRLHVDVDAKGHKSIDGKPVKSRWEQVQADFVEYYGPKDKSDLAAAETHAVLAEHAKATCDKFAKRLDKYLNDNVDDIAAYFGSLNRFDNDKERLQGAPFQKERRWDRMKELREEAAKWIDDIEAQERAYARELYSLLDENEQLRKLRDDRGLPPASWNPLKWDRMKQLNVAVTVSLTAIGLCLMLGLCTPLAALGGAAFMAFVVMTQPAFPTIYPHDPPVVGHALLVNKDFIEMVALLVIAATRAGRWGGLDIFLHRWILRPIFCRKSA
jgi:uncharacterized membrane protein YphA (DoxX/SURF4 family)